MKTWLWVRWLLIFKCVGSAPRNFRIAVDDVSIKIFDAELLEKFDCQVLQIDNKSYVNCQIVLKRYVDQLKARSILDFWKPNGQAMKLFDARLDACLFMGSVHKNRFFNIYAKALKKYSNLKCPLKPNFTYTLEKLNLDEQDFPAFVPLGSFRCNTEFTFNDSMSKAIRIIVRGKILPRRSAAP
ncbi:uncharacterized protein [Drosophila kikkawai]|uniref:Uncharacterized protein n=1 Tax=Drosophila kikkawai TaxID=30033 RepID=A0A6P4JC96_DROKI|nr:uncharacterized protein LOC108086151 [Drosophila kikkawai]KAH8340556.1 hypothetical protein KR059_001196 [Drosophila kikkawai]